jgi:hypothetical protein
MSDILNWIKDYLISIFLPIICIVIGIFLIIYGSYVRDTYNASIGSITILAGIVTLLSGFALPAYFFIKSLFVSIKDLSSKETIYKISGLFGLIFAIVFILSFRDWIFNTSSDTLNALIMFFVISFGFLIILILITKVIYLIISRLIKLVTERKK